MKLSITFTFVVLVVLISASLSSVTSATSIDLSGGCPAYCNGNSCSSVTGCCNNGCSNGYSGNCTCSISPCCSAPTGATCDFYSKCLYPITRPVCPFVINTMQDKCQVYKNIEPTYSSPLSVQWSMYVRACIQKILARNVLVPAPSGVANCALATSTFFGEHLGCYLDGPISFCSLPLGDKWKVIYNGAGILFSKYWYEPLSTAAKLLYACGMKYYEVQLTTSADYLQSKIEILLHQQQINDIMVISQDNSLLIISSEDNQSALQVVESTIYSWLKANSQHELLSFKKL